MQIIFSTFLICISYFYGLLNTHSLIRFILNDTSIDTGLPPGVTLLDFIRYHKGLKGTKIGCREGDCGACTVLVGELKDRNIVYRSVTSCLAPLGNMQGKHVVTIEGINDSGLNPVQQAMCDENASQCGFCTPGFVMSLAGYCLGERTTNPYACTDGNICRCTGYKSIERAAARIEDIFRNNEVDDSIRFAVENKIVPSYFLKIKSRLGELAMDVPGEFDKSISVKDGFMGGGTDLYVQKHDEMVHANSVFLSGNQDIKVIKKENSQCIIGGAVTISEMIESSLIRKIFPEFLKYIKLISSTQIRNMSTIGGNFVNASPIGDLTVFFLALDAKLILDNNSGLRTIPLRQFYLGYKKTGKTNDEFIREILFDIPEANTYFNFEKVSKRTHLDIASVNSAARITMHEGRINKAEISAGGVSPVPMYLKKSSAFLTDKILSEKLVDEVCKIAGSEVSPISDARGSATYKRFLLQQLIRAHFIELFPSVQPDKFVMSYEEH
jgi:xanthine dehydrogenase small subunit